MKWNNKGHEFDSELEKLSSIFNKPIYIWGAGINGKNLNHIIGHFTEITAYIDNDDAKQKQKIDEKNVISFADYCTLNDKGIIIVATSKLNAPSVMNQLMKAGFKRNRDFFSLDEFENHVLPIEALYHWNQSYMVLAQIVLTERCTLRCAKCAHACYAIPQTDEDSSMDYVKKSADSFFGKVDFIREFVLIGGEPLLYKKLPEAIEYVGKHYRNQMDIFSITTNGTIIPDEKVLEMCARYKVLVRISNYSKAIPRMTNQYERLCTFLHDHGVEYDLQRGDGNWIDYGFDYVCDLYDTKLLTNKFDLCKTQCREIRENKLYYCVMARSVSDNLGLNEGKDDFLDLDSLNDNNYKKILLEFNLGYSDKGYLDMCRRCHGMDAVHYPIPVAEQCQYSLL